MDSIKNLGLLALGSRLKILLENFNQDISKIYKANNLEFEPRFFLIYHILKNNKRLKITDLAKEIGLSQPSVSQITEAMSDRGLINFDKDKKDTRIKYVSLSAKGKKLIPILEVLWKDILSAHKELFNSIGIDIIYVIEKIENALKQKSLFDRISEKSKLRMISNVDIVNYSLPLKAYFKDLNYQWLKKYFKVEKKDEEILSNPEKYILEKGGFILFSRVDGYVCGTVAIVKHKNGEFELTKMSVNEKYQGRQIGKKLATEAINRAKKLGARKIFLETSHDLTEAVRLYKKLGFVEVSFENNTKSKYERPTFKMELQINK